MPPPARPQSLADLVGWTPFQIVPRPDNILVHWIDLQDRGFDEPFFSQTIEKHLTDPARQVVTTPIAALGELAGLVESRPPGAFIFHCARAGSTLLANAFRALPGNIVLAEPPPFNQLMGAPNRYDTDGPWPGWLRDLLICLSQPRRPDDRRSIVKFNSLTALEGERLARVFPQVPCIFLYRHPLEVMVSALEAPPVWLQIRQDPAGAARRLALPPEAIAEVSAEDFAGQALRRIFETALAQDHWLFLNYEDLTAANLPAIAAALGLPDAAASAAKLAGVFQQDAKSAGPAAFTADSAKKRAAAGPAVQAAFATHLADAYQALEARRLRFEGC